MDQYIFELSVPSSPSFWMPTEEGPYPSPSTEGSSDSSPIFPLQEQNEEFFIPQEPIVTFERHFSFDENSYTPSLYPAIEANQTQHLAIEVKGKSARVQRRRVQNRKAQQAFRERQAQRIQNLEQSVEELLKRRNDFEEAAKNAENLESTVKELLKQKEEAEKNYLELKGKYDQLKEELKRLSA